jgi:hypothetical protein
MKIGFHVALQHGWLDRRPLDIRSVASSTEASTESVFRVPEAGQ